MADLETLKNKYRSVLDLAKQHGASLSHVHIQNDKLFIQGAAPNEDVKNAIWNQIKSVDSGYSDLSADISIDSSLPQPQTKAAAATAGGGSQRSYTVQSGDTLSKIAKEFYGNANQYQQIADANGIADPDKIRAGQELVIP